MTIKGKMIQRVAIFALTALVGWSNFLAAAQQNSSLPSLSERANGVNSRYLSAASTASLAAATVAASNAVPQGGSSNSQDNNRNYHQQQQQQQQPQPQQQVAQINQNQPAQQQPAQPAVGQAPQYSASVAATPVMSTTYTFNPLTGQFVPTDLAASSVIANLGNFNPQQQQQQQQPFFVANGQVPVSNVQWPAVNRQAQRFNQSPYPQVNGQFPYGQLQRPLGGQQQFSRRYGSNSAPSASQSNRFNLGVNFGQQPQQPIEDDSGFFQQQVANSGGLIAGLINSDPLIGGFGLDSAYGNLPGNSYLLSSSNQFQGSTPSRSQQQQPYGDSLSILSQPSSVAPSILPTPTTSFGPAYSGPPDPVKTDQCVAADNRHGTCYQASECIKRGGTPMGKCGSGPSEFSGSSYVCCLFDVSCGQFAAERFVYFRNPNYPNSYDQSRMCRAKIGKLDKGVCQFRLDLLRFDVAKPTNGNCSNDMFVVSGQNENYVIPKICGLNDGQHYYVGVDESGVITLHMMMMGFYRRNFEILITQIPCRSDYAAPAHCLQYYMGTHGTIKSFNYDDSQQLGYDLLQQQASQQQDGASVSLAGAPTAPYNLPFGAANQLQQRQLSGGRFTNPFVNSYGNQENLGGYPNDLDYTMCIRKESGFCSITYQLSRGDQGLQPFAVGYQLFGNDSSLAGQFAPGVGQGWQPVSTECRDDYLLIGGVRLCSGQSANSQYNQFNDVNQASIQFAQNGSVLNSAGISGQSLQLQQQLQQQQILIQQQLARIQQQQAAASAGGNVSYATSGNSNQVGNPQNGQQQQTGNGNLEQQQAALVQQLILIQQQLNLLAGNGNAAQLNRPLADGQLSDGLQGAIITDTTPGPFILRFVSNTARNARGFHIDYRQNPCK